MGEIMDSKAPVFAGQIFAEMLAGICHEEFYRYSDQGGKQPFPNLFPRVSLLSSCPLPRSPYPPSSLYAVHFTLSSLLRFPQSLTFTGLCNLYNTHLLPVILCLLPQDVSPIPPRHRLRPPRNSTIRLTIIRRL